MPNEVLTPAIDASAERKARIGFIVDRVSVQARIA